MTLTQNGYDCVPPCKSCREAGECAKAFDVPASEVVSVRMSQTEAWFRYGPAGCLPSIALPCGCHGIPWPVVHKLGENFSRLTCDKHGEQKLTKSWLSKARGEAKKHDRRQNTSGTLDIPPY